MKKQILNLIIVFGLLTALPGCHTYSLVASHDSDSITTEKATRYSFVGGLIKPKNINAGCPQESISNLTVKTNIGHQLITLFTFGMVVPVGIEWSCSPPEENVEPITLENE